MCSYVWKFLFAEHPSLQFLLTKEDKVLKIGEKFENESERIFIATKIVRQKDSNRIESALND